MTAISQSRPVDKALVDPKTNRASLDWDNFFNKLQGQVANTQTNATVQSVTATATTAINLANGGVVALALSASITTMTVTGAPTTGTMGSINFIVTQGGSYTIVWPTGTKWTAGTTPVVTTGAGKIDIYVLITVDAGTTWYGFVTGQNMA